MSVALRPLLAGVLLALSGLAAASEPAQLTLLAEHPVEGMRGGNLSGLAWCGDALLAVSDRDDDRIYRFDVAVEGVWQAEVEPLAAPPAPLSGLPWGMRVRNGLAGMLRGGELDFEGISCDAMGNRYLVSESKVAVLRVPPAGTPQWLPLPAGVVRQARASGMLLQANAMFEGITVDPAGERLWLAAERQRRGLLVVHNRRGSWACRGGCVLMAEGGDELPPPALGNRARAKDFSALAFHGDKLFVLERLAHRICRRHPATAAVERCWSFSEVALADSGRYASPYGLVEALEVDEQGAWLGVDNNERRRADGELRPVVWRLAAPAKGWLQQ